MAKIKDMQHVTVEQVLALRSAAIELEQQRDDLLAALEAAVECGMVPSSSASEGGANRHAKQVHVADQIRAAISKVKGDIE